MIVVVGSRHDKVAARLVRAWRGALCSAEDLTGPGWAWRTGGGPRTWRIAGEPVDDRDVSGVLVRRSAVYAEELTAIHPEDRAYVAAESTAFLAYVLATTAARVCNPVVDGAFGDEALGFDRLCAVAAALAVPIRPLRFTTEARTRPPAAPALVEVVGERCFGRAPDRDRDAARALAAKLGLAWATFAFDGRHRLVAARASAAPGKAAAAALGRLLGAGR